MAGELTRSQLVSEILDNVTRSGTGQTKSGQTLSSLAIRYLNRAQLKIARQEDLLFCLTTASTVASQQTYALPSNIRALYSMRLEDGLSSRKLICVMPWDFDKLVPKPNESTTGLPTWYVPYGTTNTFELFRIPDTSYVLRLRYSYWPTSLTTDAQTSDYTYMDDVLIHYATANLWFWLQEYTDAKEWRMEGDRLLVSAIEAEKTANPDWTPVGEGFSTAPSTTIAEYYNDPFIRSMG